MCDDFFEENFEDSLFDPSNDFEELLVEEAGEWYEDAEDFFDGAEAEISSVSPDNNPDSFDLTDAMLWGMVGGAFYDAATADKQQLKRAKTEKKTKK